MIGEAIYIRVYDRKYNPIATKRGNVPTQSWRGKSAVIRMYCALTFNGYSNSIKAVKRQRNLGLLYRMYMYAYCMNVYCVYLWSDRELLSLNKIRIMYNLIIFIKKTECF